ncbi:MAG: peptide-methionine (R)-S-oxide reductase MsrB [Deltaproteobacteria bacterium]|nr:peptide-methionine (R)-S-oxide reductase MsrB [Deltaproteobacteria bacterium]
MTRRGFLSGLLALTIGSFLWRRGETAPPTSMNDIEKLQGNWKSFLAEGLKIPHPSEPLQLSKQQWSERLDPKQYHILREEGTERPWTSPLNNEKRAGIYTCAGCDLPLFTSEMKFDSGTGWPSFFTTIPGVFGTTTDYKLIWPRTEYHCIRCGGHHGHVFRDGPPPTGERWCNNGVALKFVPKNVNA